MRFKVLLLACLYYICSTGAIAIIPQLSLVNETAIANGPVNPSSLSLSKPDTPAGFKAPLTFDTTQRLNAFNLWKSALAAMYELAPHGWNSILNTEQWVMAFKGSDIVALVLAEEGVVRMGYIMIALYNAVNAMFQLQPGFFKCDTEFILQGRKIGSLEIFAMRRPPTGSVSGHAIAGNTTVNSTITTAPQLDFELFNAESIKYGGSNTLTESATDTDDPRLKINFEYQRLVPRQDLWTSVLDGMVTAAQYDAEARCQYITAVSISGNLVFHINKLSNHILSYNVAMKTFRLVAIVSMRDKVYRELEFTVSFDGIQLAEGYVLHLGTAALGGDGEPVSSER